MPLDNDFWEEENNEHTDELAAILLLLYLGALYYGIQNGSDMANVYYEPENRIILQQAQYPVVLAVGIQLATQNRVNAIVAQWEETGGNLSEMLAPVFNAARAESIAITETTRAIQAGQTLIYQETGLVKQVEFITQRDDRVCDLCAPLDGQIMDVDDPDLPPRHPNCRCETIPVI